MAEFEQQIADKKKDVETKTEAWKGKMSHKIDGVGGLKNMNACIPAVMRKQELSKAKTGRKIYSVSGGAGSTSLAVATQAGNVHTFNAVQNVQTMKPVINKFVMECGISGNAEFLAAGGMQNLVTIYKKNGATWDTYAQLEDKACPEGGSHEGYIASVDFIENDTKLMTGSGDGTVKVWDVAKKAVVQTFHGHQADVSGVAVNKFGTQNNTVFCTSSTDKHVKTWDTRQQYAIRDFTAKYSNNCCAMMPDGRGVMAGCDSASWEFFDIGCNQQVARGKVKKGRCESIAISSSGRFVYLGWDNEETGLVIADSYTPSNFKTIAGATNDCVKGMDMAPDGSALATASFDGFMKIWAAGMAQ